MPNAAVALIPARAGSKRIPGKNIRELGGYPLLAYAIRAAIGSRIFDLVIVSTDSVEYARIAVAYGALVLPRPQEYAADTSPDIEWVEHAISALTGKEIFSILRPTSPFRTAETIQRAMKEFLADGVCDSLRAVERVRQHPGKMWLLHGELGPFPRIYPYPHPWEDFDTPSHSSPTQSLPTVYVQNASLEIAWTKTVTETHTIAGTHVRPFFTEGYEGFDLNTEDDWLLAEALIANGRAKLPDIG